MFKCVTQTNVKHQRHNTFPRGYICLVVLHSLFKKSS